MTEVTTFIPEDGSLEFIQEMVRKDQAAHRELMQAADAGTLEKPDLEAGPWYLEGEFGFCTDAEDSREAANRIYDKLGLGEALAWTERYHRFVVIMSISGAAFRGMRQGRQFAAMLLEETEQE